MALHEWLSLGWPQSLLRLIPFLQFIDRDDMLALYRSALNGPIAQWLIELTDFHFDDQELDSQLSKALEDTWICPVTDSMDIAQFLHVNSLGKHSERPSWKVLRSFGSPEKILEYVAERGYKRLILIEDFVGSGTQIAGPVIFAARTLDLPVLVVPLVVSHLASVKVSRIARRFPKITYRPLFEVPRSAILFRSPELNEHPLFGGMREIVGDTFDRVAAPVPPDTEKLTKPFGFCDRFGMFVVLHTNCPNNSLPLLWHSSPTWMRCSEGLAGNNSMMPNSRPKNPFQELYLTEAIEDPELYWNWFSPAVITGQTEALYRRGNVVLIGHHGAGKTMLLRLFSPQVQAAYLRAGVKLPIGDSPLLGVSINFVHAGFGSLGQRTFGKDRADDQLQWALLAGDLLNYHLVDQLFDTLLFLQSPDAVLLAAHLRAVVSQESLNSFAEWLGMQDCWFGAFKSINTFADLHNAIKNRIATFRAYINWNRSDLPDWLTATKTEAALPLFKQDWVWLVAALFPQTRR